jgi:hypothetical protein
MEGFESETDIAEMLTFAETAKEGAKNITNGMIERNRSEVLLNFPAIVPPFESFFFKSLI